MEKAGLNEKILHIVQQHGPIGAPGVGEPLRLERDISLNAVQTVLNRLVARGVWFDGVRADTTYTRRRCRMPWLRRRRPTQLRICCRTPTRLGWRT